MKDKGLLAIQVIAGLMLVVFGLNKFLQFIPMGAPAEQMGAFLGALGATGYMFPLIAVIEIVAGVSFLLNKYASLMVLVVIPVMLNAFLAHLFLDPAGIGGSALIMLMLIGIIVRHFNRYKDVLRA